mgnify:CR=1 FL=1
MGIFNTIRRLTERFSNHLSAIKFEKVSVMTIQAQLSTFNFESNSIRTLAINNEPWFVAKDVCDAIGLTNSRMSLIALDEDEKGVSLIYTPSGQQEVNIISESGMYTLILRCRDAVKKGSIPHRFRKWVTSEVLPAIRKTGKYQLQPQQLALPEPEKFTFEFTEYELEQLVWLWCGHKQMNTLLGDMIKPLETIGSYFTGYGDVVIQLVKVTAERDKCASQVDNLNKWINQAKGGK